MAVLFTIGHGTRSLAELATSLGQAGVTHLADVRRHPGSRRSPQLGLPAMAAELPAHGVDYRWWGEDLGGRRSAGETSRHPAWRNASFRAYADHMDSPAFRRTFCRLLEAATTGPTAVMCAETLWWRCHRRLLADAAVLQGWEVVHLMGDGQRRPHVPNSSMRPDESGWPVYDLSAPTGDRDTGDWRSFSWSWRIRSLPWRSPLPGVGVAPWSKDRAAGCLAHSTCSRVGP